jgi:NADH dehydrogenase/NADH:ubiquinone oxidoreductase subunit G
MGLAVKIYEAFKDDETKARVLADVIESLEQIIKVNEVATRSDIKNTELALTKEIEQIRKDMKETELKLTKEIEKVRADLSKEIEKVRADLSKEIEEVRADLSKEIEEVRADLSIDIEKSRAETSISLGKLRSDLIEKIEEKHSSSIRWLVALFITQSVGVAGLIVTLFQILR